jgi:hypothetical protein
MKDQDMHSSSNRSPSTVPYRVDAASEDNYWRSNFENEPYYNRSYDYGDYAPAYQLGYQGRERYAGHSYDAAESHLSNDWNQAKGKSRMLWDDAKHAVRAGWHRVERALPGDADRDGR